MSEPIRAERATVKFFDGLEVDGFRMPNGEFRVGITGASRVLGYSDVWLYLALNGKSQKRLETLRGLGFTEQTLEIKSETSVGLRTAETIGLRDFNRLRLASLAMNPSFRMVAGTSPDLLNSSLNPDPHPMLFEKSIRHIALLTGDTAITLYATSTASMTPAHESN